VGIAPDLVGFQAWNANSADLVTNLNCVAGIASSPVCQPASCTNCDAIPTSKMVITEFGTGTSLEAAPVGNGIASFGDNQTPTTTLEGQKQHLTNTLCAFQKLGINKFAYFGFYDSASTWAIDFSYSGSVLAWNGYWGLSSEIRSYGDKPALTAMLNYPSLGCPDPAIPVVALMTDAPYYVAGDQAQVTYSAADVTSLSINATRIPPSFSCINNTFLSPDPLGSCGYTKIVIQGSPPLLLTGTNGSPPGKSALPVRPFTVGTMPLLDHVDNLSNATSCRLATSQGCPLNATQLDRLFVYGLGFDRAGGNIITLTGPGTVYLFEANPVTTPPPVFIQSTPGLIDAALGCFVSPGTWTLTVKNPNSATPSAGMTLVVSHHPNCP